MQRKIHITATRNVDDAVTTRVRNPFPDTFRSSIRTSA